MTTAPPDLQDIAGDLVREGWSACKDWLPASFVAPLAAEARERRAASAFHRAGVGVGRRHEPPVRGDEIVWLEQALATPSQRAAFDRLEALRLALNRELALGLFELETHFSVYPPGARYTTHLDRFHDDDSRVLSVVLYLNRDWRAADGGALRLYLETADREPFIDVPPVGGTLVAFLSGRFPHEVLPARRERLSLTGWFRRRGIGTG